MEWKAMNLAIHNIFQLMYFSVWRIWFIDVLEYEDGQIVDLEINDSMSVGHPHGVLSNVSHFRGHSTDSHIQCMMITFWDPSHRKRFMSGDGEKVISIYKHLFHKPFKSIIFLNGLVGCLGLVSHTHRFGYIKLSYSQHGYKSTAAREYKWKNSCQDGAVGLGGNITNKQKWLPTHKNSVWAFCFMSFI